MQSKSWVSQITRHTFWCHSNEKQLGKWEHILRMYEISPPFPIQMFLLDFTYCSSDSNDSKMCVESTEKEGSDMHDMTLQKNKNVVIKYSHFFGRFFSKLSLGITYFSVRAWLEFKKTITRGVIYIEKSDIKKNVQESIPYLMYPVSVHIEQCVHNFRRYY